MKEQEVYETDDVVSSTKQPHKSWKDQLLSPSLATTREERTTTTTIGDESFYFINLKESYKFRSIKGHQSMSSQPNIAEKMD